MTQLQMHHVGFLVDELEEGARNFVTTLGFRIESDVIEDRLQTARVRFLRQPGERHWLELVSPLGEDSKLHGALRRGVALHHLCYEVTEIEAGLALLRNGGCLTLGRPVPGAAYDGWPIAWTIDRLKGLIELVAAGPGARSLAALERQIIREAT